jgi:hypothetical protein
MTGDRKFGWDKNKAGVCLYGLDLLPAAGCPVFPVEGESDCHTFWHHGYDAVGAPGAGTYNPARDDAYLEGYPLVIILEPGKGGEAFLQRLSLSKHRASISVASFGGLKDASSVHLDASTDFHAVVERAIAKAEPLDTVLARQPRLDTKRFAVAEEDPGGDEKESATSVLIALAVRAAHPFKSPDELTYASVEHDGTGKPLRCHLALSKAAGAPLFSQTPAGPQPRRPVPGAADAGRPRPLRGRRTPGQHQNGAARRQHLHRFGVQELEGGGGERGRLAAHSGATSAAGAPGRHAAIAGAGGTPQAARFPPILLGARSALARASLFAHPTKPVPPCPLPGASGMLDPPRSGMTAASPSSRRKEKTMTPHQQIDELEAELRNLYLSPRERAEIRAELAGLKHKKAEWDRALDLEIKKWLSA